jgi:hypothetical protein
MTSDLDCLLLHILLRWVTLTGLWGQSWQGHALPRATRGSLICTSELKEGFQLFMPPGLEEVAGEEKVQPRGSLESGALRSHELDPACLCMRAEAKTEHVRRRRSCLLGRMKRIGMLGAETWRKMHKPAMAVPLFHR